MSNRDKKGRWTPGGPSPNPKGKPKGALSPSTKLRKMIEGYMEPVVASLIKAAARGDVQAASLLLARSLPPARPERPMITVDLDGATTPAQIAQRVIDAAARGEISVDTANDFTAALLSVQKVRDADAIEARFAAIEKKLAEGKRDAR